ncbi:MAG TPA: sigma-70 family RNA polymerase sigma factor [Pirellulaceae bacterium]|nr:sigma-70 family RNA polymerase sigma factor [Pirellulaceae bacterium]HMO93108.1 sigma-70 family RNA polymerase sigma factor [Pirellulaceae bacterium]HMP70333.1 sigma-70 family RNA polymerase sigma factor [Pirellulaceae bacterium]
MQNGIDDEFVRCLNDVQVGLLRYVTTLLGNHESAKDVVQEANFLLWSKRDEFIPGTNFEAWATKVAYWQARAYLRDKGRDKLVFGEELMSDLAARPGLNQDFAKNLETLKGCLETLRVSDHELISLRYGNNYSIEQISGQTGKSPSAIKGALMRARRWLQACVRRRLGHETERRVTE